MGLADFLYLVPPGMSPQPDDDLALGHAAENSLQHGVLGHGYTCGKGSIYIFLISNILRK